MIKFDAIRQNLREIQQDYESTRLEYRELQEQACRESLAYQREIERLRRQVRRHRLLGLVCLTAVIVLATYAFYP